MKRSVWSIAVLSAACLILCCELAQGRGGRGGGGGGGGARPSVGGARPGVGGGGGASVRPSVGDRGAGLGAGNAGLGDRPGFQPGSPGVGSGIGKPGGVGPGPSKGQLQDFLDIGNPGPGAATRPAGPSQGAVADFFQNGPSVGPGVKPGIPGGPLPGGPIPGGPGKIAGKGPIAGGKAGPIQGNRPTRVENRQELAQNRQNRRQEIQDEFRDNYPRWDFALDHPRWAAWRVNRPYRWATVAALTGWCGYANASYYDYGENIYYQDGAVYSDGQQIASADQYAAAAEQIATNIPQAKDPDWLCLGVFAITQDGSSSGPAPTMFLQLNVSKQGILAGSLQNTSAGTNQPIEGMVDKQSQRAAWVISGKTRPIMETGIFNLSRDTAPALLHFADGQTQQWLLVRMDEPKQ